MKRFFAILLCLLVTTPAWAIRFPSGVTDQKIYFVAVDATDRVTPETGLASFTVQRSRNGAAEVAFTTPTVTEIDAANTPGLYALTLDEDMTIDAGDDSQEVALYITHAGMAPVYRTYELYRPKITAGETVTTASGKVALTTAEHTTISQSAGLIYSGGLLPGGGLPTVTTGDDLAGCTFVARAVGDDHYEVRSILSVSGGGSLTLDQALTGPFDEDDPYWIFQGSRKVNTALPNITAGSANGLFRAGVNAQSTVTGGWGAGTITNTSFAVGAIDANAVATGAVTLGTELAGFPANFASFAIDAGGNAQVSVSEWVGNPIAPPTVPGVPEVDLTHVNGTGPVVTQTLAVNEVGEVSIDLEQAVPNSNTAGTTGDALNAARAQGFGRWVINVGAKTLTLYGPDGTTPVKVFNIAPTVNAPTSRTPQ